eukprot:Seg1680.2 transcript_id=Seg1680.2/GoldUCD/mRNA.D3Y31 product="E3 ubiquitin-protein ligase rnf168" protein_id=Seg1680.2/GoldUCD/D3Y31
MEGEKEGKEKSTKRKQNGCSFEEKEGTESYTDFMCPICLQLLIEPVVMPCKHELCRPCFTEHVEATSLLCPMCRVRISCWARKRAREGNLVDEERWNKIQRLFPERCKRRLNGEDDDDDLYLSTSTFVPVVAKDGEVRQEYEKELQKAEMEMQEELKASEEIIKRFQEEERLRQEELERDEKMAKQLQTEELQTAGGKFTSPNTKLSRFLDACKLPQEMSLRSGSANRMSASKANDKPKTNCLTNWLSKSSLGSPGPSNADESFENNMLRTPMRSKQEEEDFEMAFKLQRALDMESKTTPSRKKINDHFYPLRQKSDDSSNRPPAKRLKTK